MIKKRIGCLLIVAVLLIGSVKVVTADPSPGTISLASVTAEPGETVTVPVTLAENPGLITLRVKVIAADDLTLTDISATGLLPGFQTSGSDILYWKNALTTQNVLSTGAIAQLTFRVSETAKPGKKSVTLQLLNSFRADGTENTFSVTAGAVSVGPTVWGDANDDTLVDTTDLVALKKCLAGLMNRSECGDGTDVNADGTVDTTDLVVLKKYLAGLLDRLGPQA